MADLITCVDGEVAVDDIIDAINSLLISCEEVSACCEIHSAGDVIRTYVSGNVLYMTNDGSDPMP